MFSYNIAMTLPETSKQYRPTLLQWVMSGKMKTNLQVTEAVAYLKKIPSQSSVWSLSISQEQVDLKSVEEACGIGITVDRDEIKQSIASLIESHRDELVKERYTYPISKLLYSLKEGRMKWADGKKVKEQFDQSIFALLGEKTEEDEKVCCLIE